MASFTLSPCKLRDGWIVPVKNAEKLVVDWKGLCAKLAPHRTPAAILALGKLKTLSYAGLRKLPSGQQSCFVLHNANLSGDARGLVRANPNLVDQLVELYRVEQVVWDRTFIEPVGRIDTSDVAPPIKAVEMINGPSTSRRRR